MDASYMVTKMDASMVDEINTVNVGSRSDRSRNIDTFITHWGSTTQ